MVQVRNMTNSPRREKKDATPERWVKMRKQIFLLSLFAIALAWAADATIGHHFTEGGTYVGKLFVDDEHLGARVIEAVCEIILGEGHVERGVNSTDLGTGKPEQSLFDCVVHEGRHHIAFDDAIPRVPQEWSDSSR